MYIHNTSVTTTCSYFKCMCVFWNHNSQIAVEDRGNPNCESRYAVHNYVSCYTLVYCVSAGITYMYTWTQSACECHVQQAALLTKISFR